MPASDAQFRSLIRAAIAAQDAPMPAGSRPWTMRDIAQHAQDHGSHWFDASTMEWFGSHHAAGPILGADGRYWFISSEQDRHPSPELRAWNGMRRFTVRAYDPDRAHVDTVGEFGAHATRRAAYGAMRAMLRTLSAR